KVLELSTAIVLPAEYNALKTDTVKVVALETMAAAIAGTVLKVDPTKGAMVLLHGGLVFSLVLEKGKLKSIELSGISDGALALKTERKVKLFEGGITLKPEDLSTIKAMEISAVKEVLTQLKAGSITGETAAILLKAVSKFGSNTELMRDILVAFTEFLSSPLMATLEADTKNSIVKVLTTVLGSMAGLAGVIREGNSIGINAVEMLVSILEKPVFAADARLALIRAMDDTNARPNVQTVLFGKFNAYLAVRAKAKEGEIPAIPDGMGQIASLLTMNLSGLPETTIVAIAETLFDTARNAIKAGAVVEASIVDGLLNVLNFCLKDGVTMPNALLTAVGALTSICQHVLDPAFGRAINMPLVMKIVESLTRAIDKMTMTSVQAFKLMGIMINAFQPLISQISTPAKAAPLMVLFQKAGEKMAAAFKKATAEEKTQILNMIRGSASGAVFLSVGTTLAGSSDPADAALGFAMLCAVAGGKDTTQKGTMASVAQKAGALIVKLMSEQPSLFAQVAKFFEKNDGSINQDFVDTIMAGIVSALSQADEPTQTKILETMIVGLSQSGLHTGTVLGLLKSLVTSIGSLVDLAKSTGLIRVLAKCIGNVSVTALFRDSLVNGLISGIVSVNNPKLQRELMSGAMAGIADVRDAAVQKTMVMQVVTSMTALYAKPETRAAALNLAEGFIGGIKSLTDVSVRTNLARSIGSTMASNPEFVKLLIEGAGSASGLPANVTAEQLITWLAGGAIAPQAIPGAGAPLPGSMFLPTGGTTPLGQPIDLPRQTPEGTRPIERTTPEGAGLGQTLPGLPELGEAPITTPSRLPETAGPALPGPAPAESIPRPETAPSTERPTEPAAEAVTPKPSETPAPIPTASSETAGPSAAPAVQSPEELGAILMNDKATTQQKLDALDKVASLLANPATRGEALSLLVKALCGSDSAVTEKAVKSLTSSLDTLSTADIETIFTALESIEEKATVVLGALLDGILGMSDATKKTNLLSAVLDKITVMSDKT
ncbi:MAG: hypothetical protein PHT32_08410, partial [Candidatus Omnitrophica bacterium]|nr:hypothetical protein [Candidatus Omnitrophota bacterium]